MRSLKDIDAIIFDLGNVLLNIDLDRSKEAFRRLGLDEFEQFYAMNKQAQLFTDLETGKITSSEFYDVVRDHTPDATDEEIKVAWNSLLLDFPLERLDMLMRLGGEYRVFILSNTNEIHITEYKNILHRTYGIRSLVPIVEAEYYSYEMGMRKPDTQIYQAIVDERQLAAGRTLMVDDLRHNLDGAAAVGMQTLWIGPNDDVSELLG